MASPKDALCVPPGCDQPLQILAEATTPRLLPTGEFRVRQNGSGAAHEPAPPRPPSVSSRCGTLFQTFRTSVEH